ncbi:MAG TPA: DUF1684 domain-containing protein [Mycobacteriales bacterium]|nr:DUF1684 domain-containing protein [Mycobacteriales bacterium]
MSLDVLDWRRRTAALYELVRTELYPPVAHAGWVASREELFRTHPASPVTDAQYDLPVAPYDPQWRAEVALEAAPRQRIEVPSGTDGVVPFERLGVLRTPWGDLDAWWLASYGGGVWVPVRDRTSGGTSYGGGRYLLDTVKGADLGSTADCRLVLDLNFLYAPSCAHDEAWACPLAPPGNVLDVEVTAGEQLH